MHFENSTMPGHFGAAFNDYSAREVTWLSPGGLDLEYDNDYDYAVGDCVTILTV